MGMEISRSKRPGRRRAGSNMLGRLVAASTTTCWRCERPSIRAKQLRHDALFHVAHRPIALRGDGVDLVEEDDARRLAGRLVEKFPQVGFALAVELMDDFRAVDGEEVGLGFVGHGPGDQRLAAAGRPQQQHALGRFDAQPLEQFRVSQRQLDDLAHPIELPPQAADVFIGDGRRRRRRARLALAAPPIFNSVSEAMTTRPLRVRALDQEIGIAVAEQRGPNAVAGDHGQAVQQTADVLQIAVGGHVAERMENDFGGRRGAMRRTTVDSPMAAPAFSRMMPSI